MSYLGEKCFEQELPYQKVKEDSGKTRDNSWENDEFNGWVCLIVMKNSKSAGLQTVQERRCSQNLRHKLWDNTEFCELVLFRAGA
jgi:hypothetical protein